MENTARCEVVAQAMGCHGGKRWFRCGTPHFSN